MSAGWKRNSTLSLKHSALSFLCLPFRHSHRSIACLFYFFIIIHNFKTPKAQCEIFRYFKAYSNAHVNLHHYFHFVGDFKVIPFSCRRGYLFLPQHSACWWYNPKWQNAYLFHFNQFLGGKTHKAGFAHGHIWRVFYIRLICFYPHILKLFHSTERHRLAHIYKKLSPLVFCCAAAIVQYIANFVFIVFSKSEYSPPLTS